MCLCLYQRLRAALVRGGLHDGGRQVLSKCGKLWGSPRGSFRHLPGHGSQFCCFRADVRSEEHFTTIHSRKYRAAIEQTRARDAFLKSKASASLRIAERENWTYFEDVLLRCTPVFCGLETGSNCRETTEGTRRCSGEASRRKYFEVPGSRVYIDQSIYPSRQQEASAEKHKTWCAPQYSTGVKLGVNHNVRTKLGVLPWLCALQAAGTIMLRAVRDQGHDGALG